MEREGRFITNKLDKLRIKEERNYATYMKNFLAKDIKQT